MNHKAYQPKMPDLMEAVFDAAYLIFDLIAGILFSRWLRAAAFLSYMAS